MPCMSLRCCLLIPVMGGAVVCGGCLGRGEVGSFGMYVLFVSSPMCRL